MPQYSVLAINLLVEPDFTELKIHYLWILKRQYFQLWKRLFNILKVANDVLEMSMAFSTT
ncbi:hypothetical protein [Providencia hangzhouensis]|uniref:hypothetical protein n=1 Tax=Providencia hangzhouensis TaxID=3031799 RepID=UPI003F68C59E